MRDREYEKEGLALKDTPNRLLLPATTPSGLHFRSRKQFSTDRGGVKHERGRGQGIYGEAGSKEDFGALGAGIVCSSAGKEEKPQGRRRTNQGTKGAPREADPYFGRSFLGSLSPPPLTHSSPREIQGPPTTHRTGHLGLLPCSLASGPRCPPATSSPSGGRSEER